MTQALALRDWCQRRGHAVVAVMAGAHPNRSWPAFFEQGFEVPVTPLRSPGFVYRRQRRVNLPATLWQLVSRMGSYRASLRRMDAVLQQTQPDLLVNFLEPLVGWHQRRGGISVPVLAVGHQYMLSHPGYPRLSTMRSAQWGLRRFVSATGGADLRYALSFYEAEPVDDRTVVGPPLLRDDLLQRDGRANHGHVLVYLLNAGYLPELMAWQLRHGASALHVFCERPGSPEEESLGNGVTVHRLHAEKFLRLMATARAVVCSAGFESLSEAAWLGKPALAVPVEGHIEQMLNALDLERAGLGRACGRFDLSRLDDLKVGSAHERFQGWVRESDARLDQAFSRVLAAARAGMMTSRA
jgi:uncharacterized protein (TIGR00661 family)